MILSFLKFIYFFNKTNLNYARISFCYKHILRMAISSVINYVNLPENSPYVKTKPSTKTSSKTISAADSVHQITAGTYSFP